LRRYREENKSKDEGFESGLSKKKVKMIAARQRRGSVDSVRGTRCRSLSVGGMSTVGVPVDLFLFNGLEMHQHCSLS
jgi:hypothetical protein